VRGVSVERLAGFFMIAGFVMLVIGGLAAPSGAYQGSIEERLAVIDANHAQWILSKILDGAAVAFMAAGGLLLVFGLSRRNWLGIVGGVSLGVAGIVGLFYVYRLATDPGPLYDRDTPVPMVIVLVGLTAVGLLAVSLHFLRAGYPRWAGSTGAVVGVAALVGLAVILILRPGPEPMFLVELLAFLGILCIGIMLVRQRAQLPVEEALGASKADGVR
jgi:hypothetical protein